MAGVRRRDLVRAFLRSLSLQASWSFEGMQSLGFAYAMEPVLVRVHDGQRLIQARNRHLDFFNTHPFLAAAVLGCAARLEEEGGPGVDEEVRRVKGALMGPYGATGDTFYWGALKPVLIVLALHGAFRGLPWVPWAFLAAWTAANVGGRIYLFAQGYRRGVEVVEVVDRLRLLETARTLKAATALLLGALLACAVGPDRFGAAGPGRVAAWAVGVAALTFVLVWIIERGVSPVWLAYLSAAVAAGIVAWT